MGTFVLKPAPALELSGTDGVVSMWARALQRALDRFDKGVGTDAEIANALDQVVAATTAMPRFTHQEKKALFASILRRLEWSVRRPTPCDTRPRLDDMAFEIMVTKLARHVSRHHPALMSTGFGLYLDASVAVA